MTEPRRVLLASEPPRSLLLQKRIGRGGQAVVYVSESDPQLAVKLYYEPAPDVERRLDGMLRLARAHEFVTQDGARHPELAWPIALVRDADGRDVIGYAMQRVGAPDFFPLGMLFDGRRRRAEVGEVSWRFLVGVARNLAGLVATLHARGLVLGDVSHANVVVSEAGYLTVLDCDSMQFVAPHSGERFPCLVLTAEYAAPELQRNGNRERTPASDCFSLGLLVYRLLLMNDHAFMGIRRSAAADDESGTTDNIRDGFSYLVRPEEMDVPPSAYDPGLLPPRVLQLARRTFGEGHSLPELRPAANEWLAALDEAHEALVVCSRERLHVYGGHLSTCPWCARVAAGMSDPFVGHATTNGHVRPRRPAAPEPAVPVPPLAEDSRGHGTAVLAVLLLLLVLALLLL